MLRSLIPCRVIRCAIMSGKGCAFYAVRRGRSPGVYNTWSECEAQVKGFKNAAYKKFLTKDDAWEFVNLEKSVSSSNGKRKHSENTDNQEVSSSDKASKSLKTDSGDIGTGKNMEPGDTVIVYTDGASSCNGYHGAQAGIGIYWGPDHPLNTSKRLPGRQTNNRAEIHAAVHALKQAKEIGAKNVKLHSDSQFLIKGITEWIHNWKKNGWKLSGNGGPVINKEDFEALEAAAEGLNVEWIYVKAHDSNVGNIQADKLAVAGARKPLEEGLENDGGRELSAEDSSSDAAIEHHDEADSSDAQDKIDADEEQTASEAVQKVSSSSDSSENAETSGDSSQVDPSETLLVYTDGTSRNYGFSGAQAGIGIYWGPDHPLNTSKRLSGPRQTNNRAEILAAAHALRQAKEIGAKKIKLHSDSNFLIKGITQWIHKWKKNGWKLSGTGGPVINKEDFEELDAAKEGLDVEWIYIKTQDENHGNSHASKLAIAGTKKPSED